MSAGPVVLISFYNKKALGVRHLEKSLKDAGYQPYVIFFKGFNSVNPSKATGKELDLLKNLIGKIGPRLIGLSVMTSLYLETVFEVNKMLKSNFTVPVVWGGVYPTLFTETCLEHADFVIRGEGEKALIELTDALLNGHSYDNIRNLAFKKDNTFMINELNPLCDDLDSLGFPEIGGNNKYQIENNTVYSGDPSLKSISYELSASRGCPYVCSYCCSVSLKRLYSGKGRFVRTRSVSSVMDELRKAKGNIKGLKFIHFWDEIFPDDASWVDEFAAGYKKEIGLPFEIWSHPLRVNREILHKLVDAGLFKVVMGIQSGSPRIRKEIFHRTERQEEIIEASQILHDCKVPQVIYDFMLRHPFESEDDIKQTYELCMQLVPPFQLQLHGLNFLPGTDIVEKAEKMGILDGSTLHSLMYSSLQDQYKTYWGLRNSNARINFWYMMILASQFKQARPALRYLAGRFPRMGFSSGLSRLLESIVTLRHYFKKGRVLLKSLR